MCVKVCHWGALFNGHATLWLWAAHKSPARAAEETRTDGTSCSSAALCSTAEAQVFSFLPFSWFDFFLDGSELCFSKSPRLRHPSTEGSNAAYQNTTKPTVITHISSCPKNTLFGCGRVNAQGQPSPQSPVGAPAGSTALLSADSWLVCSQIHTATTQQVTPHHTTAPTLQQIPRTFAQRHCTNSLKPGRPKEATRDLTLLLSPTSTQGTCMQSPVNARKEKRDLIKKHRVYSTDELYKYSAG